MIPEAITEKFLRHVEDTGNIKKACEISGFCRRTVYDRKKNDPAFAARLEEARELGIDALEDETIQAARERSDILKMFVLKAWRPKYRDRQQTDLNVRGTINISPLILEVEDVEDEPQTIQCQTQRKTIEYNPQENMSITTEEIDCKVIEPDKPL